MARNDTSLGSWLIPVGLLGAGVALLSTGKSVSDLRARVTALELERRPYVRGSYGR